MNSGNIGQVLLHGKGPYKNKAGGSLLPSNAVERDPVVSLIQFFFFFFAVVISQNSRGRPTQALRGCATAFYSLAQLCKKGDKKKKRTKKARNFKLRQTPEISREGRCVGVGGSLVPFFLACSFVSKRSTTPPGVTEYNVMENERGMCREGEPDFTTRISNIHNSSEAN